MKLSNLAWLPDDESDKVMLNTGINYQSHKYNDALKYVKSFKTAIDVGSHCGLWTVQMGRHFQRVECFEPLPRHIECWRKNCIKSFMHLHPVALGDKNGGCHINLMATQSGRSFVSGEGDFPMKRLDDFGFTDVSFIKIDVEGFEYFVIKGGEETIKANRPVMVVEQKPGHAGKYGLKDTEAVDYLVGLGASLKKHVLGDYILAWDAA